MAKLVSFTEDFECITVFSLLLGNGKHFPFLHFRRTEVIPLDYTGYRNFHRHNSAVVFATKFKRKPNWVHNQPLIINNNKWKSITFGCIGEWLSIFLLIGYANQYQSIGFYCFLLIIAPLGRNPRRHPNVPRLLKVKVSYCRSVSMRNFLDLMKLGAHGGPG